MADEQHTEMTDKPLRGKALMVAVVNRILDNPSCWNQTAWHCGTSHCFGGWSQILGGGAENEGTVRQEATAFLELDAPEADWLFDSRRMLPEFHGFVSAKLAGEDYFARDGYARDGYARDGYARDGYARDGYARDGYDRGGYDRDGYARDGYDRGGYARDGYDRGGYDRDGYARDGYARDGYDRGGYDRDGYARDGYDRGGYARNGYARDGYDRDGKKLPRLVLPEPTP